VNYEVIRSRGEARKEEVANLYKVVNRHYHDAQAALQPLMQYLEDIRKTLSTDLTTAGLGSVKNFVSNAQENAGKVDTALAKLNTVLGEASASISTTAAQTATVQATNQQPTVAAGQGASKP
jgi:phage shock protein A